VFEKEEVKPWQRAAMLHFLGSIPLDPSLTQSLEDGQAFIHLFPNSPTLSAVNIITSKLIELESKGDQ